MPIGILFWMLMILWALFGLYYYWPEDRAAGPRAFFPVTGGFLLWLLLALLGWKVFGFVVQ